MIFLGKCPKNLASKMLKELARRHKFTRDIQIELKKPLSWLEDD